MILISHRGNINGKTNQENKPEYIKKAFYQSQKQKKLLS